MPKINFPKQKFLLKKNFFWQKYSFAQILFVRICFTEIFFFFQKLFLPKKKCCCKNFAKKDLPKKICQQNFLPKKKICPKKISGQNVLTGKNFWWKIFHLNIFLLEKRIGSTHKNKIIQGVLDLVGIGLSWNNLGLPQSRANLFYVTY